VFPAILVSVVVPVVAKRGISPGWPLVTNATTEMMAASTSSFFSTKGHARISLPQQRNYKV
jgi:hypothetical protein